MRAAFEADGEQGGRTMINGKSRSTSWTGVVWGAGQDIVSQEVMVAGTWIPHLVPDKDPCRPFEVGSYKY